MSRSTEQRPRGAAVLVFDEDGHVLLIRENYGMHRWALPGGIVESWETPEQTAVREAREETGFDVELDRLVGRYVGPSSLGVEFETLVFSARIVGGTRALPADGEIAAIEWRDAADPPTPTHEVLRPALGDFASGSFDVIRSVSAFADGP